MGVVLEVVEGGSSSQVRFAGIFVVVVVVVVVVIIVG